MKSSAQGVIHKDVEEGGKRASLHDSTFFFEEIRGSSIDKGRNPRGVDTGLDLLDEKMGEAIFFHDKKDETMP